MLWPQFVGGIEAVAYSEEGRSPESYEYPETLGMSRIVSLFAVPDSDPGRH